MHTIDHFDMSKVLANSTHLMGSEGNEYDLEEDSALGIDLKERMAKQRQILNARLGLDVASKFGMNVSDIYTNEDLIPATLEVPDATNKQDEVIRVVIVFLYYLL